MSAAIDISIGWTSVGMFVGWAAWLLDFSFANMEEAGHCRVQLLGFYVKIWWHQ